ncbi:epi-neemfruitin B 7-O-acetyltransferse L7AT-like [Henckelia pumila]|uniref:epi-neemfruitin B 7-O-acetyltransferse L7AT-like n=1 Tax=Henckelia pumila TaxID=405737 RepID=UPI003C6E30C2
MEVEIISKEKVKPSSPTPPQIYKFSLLDQISLPRFYPVVLYFLPEPDSNNSSRKIHILKESLSSNLTRFYPLAGIINDDLSVKCGDEDEGIPFFVAKVRGHLEAGFLSQPDLRMITKFLPIDYAFRTPSPGDHASMIQVNCFECGGLAICVLVAHAVADVMSLTTFIRGWAAAARSTGDEAEFICPKFIGHDLFPSIDAMKSESKLYSYYFTKFARLGKFVTRRYVFDASLIAKLKERATSSDDHAKPTSIEVVTAFIWKCYMDKCNTEEPFLLTHQVNLRTRADPALPEETFGNFIWLTATKCISPTTLTGTDHFKDLVSEVDRAIRKIDSKFVQVLQNNDGYYEHFEEARKGFRKGANQLSFTSWCKFGLYDIDFGWGKPIWLSSYVSSNSESVFAGFVILNDTRSGDGIEAWVILDEKLAAAFEESEDLQNHVLINPRATC